MRRLILFLCIFALLLTSITSAQDYVENPNAVLDGCDSPVVERLDAIAMGELSGDPVTPAMFNFSIMDACIQYRACNPTATIKAFCQFQIASTLGKDCQSNDEFCRVFTVLLARAITYYESDPWGTNDDVAHVPDERVNYIENGLEMYQFGTKGVEFAINDYSSYDSYYLPHPAEAISLALMYQEMRDNESALRTYFKGILNNPNDPMLYFERLRFLVKLGRTDEATLDAEWLRRYLLTDNTIYPFIRNEIDKLPLDLSQFEQWNLWAMQTTNSNPGGSSITTLTGRPPQSVLVQQGVQPNVWLLLDNLEDTIESSFVMQTDIRLVNVGVEDITTPINEYSFYTMPRIQHVDENVWYVKFGYEVFESGGYYAYLFAPESTTDPRLFAYGFRCEDGRSSHIRNGSKIFLDTIYPLTIQGQPNGEIIVENLQYENMKVLEDGICVSEGIWWHVELSSGTVGWIFEGNTLDGQFTDLLSSTGYLPFYCPTALEPRLQYRQQYRVVTGLGPNNLRTEPSLSADVLAEIPEGTTFSQLSDPVCKDDIVWWQVGYDGQLGWTAEGANGVYFLEPVPPETP